MIEDTRNQFTDRRADTYKAYFCIMKKRAFIGIFLLFAFPSIAQQVSNPGSWYMYFGNFRFTDSPWAIHAEVQHRNHNLVGDLDQLLLRTGIQYNLKSGQASLLAGYASITTGDLGESSNSFHENRLYQEVLLRQKLGKLGINHRYRYEQRWIEGQEFRSRFRYSLSLNLPLNQQELTQKGALYLQVYDEIFINFQKRSETIQFFDRNRLYLGLGYRPSTKLAVQIGLMEQTTNLISKTQLQFSAYHQLFSKKNPTNGQ